MSNDKIQKSLNDCKECSKHIISDICELLDKKKISYTKNGKSEIYLGKVDTDMEKLIRDNLNLPNYAIILLLDIVQLKSGVYIRLKREDS